jgi:hypothetical protein
MGRKTYWVSTRQPGCRITDSKVTVPVFFYMKTSSILLVTIITLYFPHFAETITNNKISCVSEEVKPGQPGDTKLRVLDLVIQDGRVDEETAHSLIICPIVKRGCFC